MNEFLGAVAVRERFMNDGSITFGGFLILSAATLLLYGLVRQQVTTVRATAHDLACSGDLETFCNRLFGFLHGNGRKAVPSSVVKGEMACFLGIFGITTCPQITI